MACISCEDGNPTDAFNEGLLPVKSKTFLSVSLLSLAAPLLVMVTAESASAACTAGGAKTSTSTTAYAYTCYRAQPRITRYVGGSQGVVDYYGNWSTTQSTVSNSSGTNAGNAVRGGDASSAGPWVSA